MRMPDENERLGVVKWWKLQALEVKFRSVCENFIGFVTFTTFQARVANAALNEKFTTMVEYD